MEKAICPADGSGVEFGTCCESCGVYFGEPCETCGEAGYHARGCAALDLPENDEAAYL